MSVERIHAFFVLFSFGWFYHPLFCLFISHGQSLCWLRSRLWWIQVRLFLWCEIFAAWETVNSTSNMSILCCIDVCFGGQNKTAVSTALAALKIRGEGDGILSKTIVYYANVRFSFSVDYFCLAYLFNIMLFVAHQSHATAPVLGIIFPTTLNPWMLVWTHPQSFYSVILPIWQQHVDKTLHHYLVIWQKLNHSSVNFRKIYKCLWNCLPALECILFSTSTFDFFMLIWKQYYSLE